MLPDAYEFHWDLGHIIFLGVFYTVLTVVITTVAVALWRRRQDEKRSRAEAIEWHESFEDLPSERKHCRHEFDGSLDGKQRICHRGFDCAGCPDHESLAAAGRPDRETAPVGMELSENRLYHRGHLWVEREEDGVWRVGWDEFARRCCGDEADLELPSPGRRVEVGSRAVVARRGGLQARFPSPLSGTVVETAPCGSDWLLRILPDQPQPVTTHLLARDEARRWLTRELEWLQQQLGADPEMAAMADGGAMVDDLVAACPDADWDAIWGQVCLDT